MSANVVNRTPKLNMSFCIKVTGRVHNMPPQPLVHGKSDEPTATRMSLCRRTAYRVGRRTRGWRAAGAPRAASNGAAIRVFRSENPAGPGRLLFRLPYGGRK